MNDELLPVPDAADVTPADLDDPVRAFAKMTGKSYRTSARWMRAIAMGWRDDVSLTEFDRQVRVARHGDHEAVRRARRVLRDVHWLLDAGAIETVEELFYIGTPGHSRRCACCGDEFTPARADGRYCSPACRQRAYRTRRKDADG